jgi:hypothetical protein
MRTRLHCSREHPRKIVSGSSRDGHGHGHHHGIRGGAFLAGYLNVYFITLFGVARTVMHLASPISSS